MMLTTCYVCQGHLIPQEHPGTYICAVCGKEWRCMTIAPSFGPAIFIPGAKAQTGGKSSRKKKGKETLKKPSAKKLFDRLFGS